MLANSSAGGIEGSTQHGPLGQKITAMSLFQVPIAWTECSDGIILFQA